MQQNKQDIDLDAISSSERSSLASGECGASVSEQHLPQGGGQASSSFANGTPEIEVTQEMINAGLEILYCRCDPFAFVSAVTYQDLAAVYIAMASLSLAEAKSQPVPER